MKNLKAVAVLGVFGAMSTVGWAEDHWRDRGDHDGYRTHYRESARGVDAPYRGYANRGYEPHYRHDSNYGGRYNGYGNRATYGPYGNRSTYGYGPYGSYDQGYYQNGDHYYYERPGSHSAAIIGGSAAAGAGVGAMMGGVKGAIIGGVVGAAGGAVVDRTTKDNTRW